MSSVDRDVVVAAICFGGTAVTVGGPKAEPVRFVVSIAEALNGLRATPAADSRPRRRARPAEASPSPSPARLRHTATVSQSLLVDPGGFPVLWGAALDVQLGLTPHWALAIGGFLPIVRAELSTPHAELRTGLTFLRLGPALRYSLGPFALSGSLAVGPAFTWVTAHAVAPYVAQPAFASGVLSSAGLALLYPSRGRVFALAGGRASLLLPAPRISALDQQRHDLGPLLLETSLGIGLRL